MTGTPGSDAPEPLPGPSGFSAGQHDDLWEACSCSFAAGSAFGKAGTQTHAVKEAEGVALWPAQGNRGAEPSRRDADASDLERGLTSAAESPSSRRLLEWGDLIGVSLERSARLLRLVHCPKRSQRCCGGGTSRLREDVLLHIGGDGEAELHSADRWAAAIFGDAVPRHYLVLINPASGSGKAPQIWAQAKALLDCATGLRITERQTTRAGEAFDVAKELDLTTCDGIVIVSGDGLVHEVFCGLLAHADKASALQMPIGHIPGGSGNGLVSSVLHACGESYGVLDATFMIAKGGVQPIDLASVQLPGASPKSSFLSLSWGFISDVDIESERLRCIGGLRFPVYAVWLVLRMRTYTGKLQYWPPEAGDLPPEPPVDAPLPQEEKWRTIEGEFMTIWGQNTTHAASDMFSAPSAKLGDGLWQLVVVRRASRWQFIRFLLGLETGSHMGFANAEMLPCRAFRLDPQRHSQAREGYLSLDGEVVPYGPVQVWVSGQGAVIGAET